MIKKLKTRFIIVSLLTVLFVLFATIFSINTYNYVKIENEAQHSLTMVIDHGLEEKEIGIGPNPKPGEQNILREHYFIVSFDDNGEITGSNFKHIFSISDEEGKELALKVYNQDSSYGKNGSLRYKKDIKEGTTLVAFIDINERIGGFNNFLITSTIVSLISYAVLAGLIVLAAQIVFKTSEESYYYEIGHMKETLYYYIAKKGTGSESPYTFNELKQIKENLKKARKESFQNGTKTRKQLDDSFRSINYDTKTIRQIFSTLDTRGNIIVITYRTTVGEEDRLTYMYIEKN